MNFASERVRKFYRLPPREGVLLVQAWGFFLLAELALRLLSVSRLLGLAHRFASKKRHGTLPASAPPMSRVVWLVDIAARYAPVHVTCLKKALVLSWLLGRRGVATTLHIGIARCEGKFTAHAWLERDGGVLLGSPEGEAYEALLSSGLLLREPR